MITNPRPAPHPPMPHRARRIDIIAMPSNGMPENAAPNAVSRSTPNPKLTAKPKAKHWRTILHWAPVLFAAALAGMAAQVLVYGEIVVAAYGVFVLLRRIESRTTFILALVALSAIVAILIFKGDGVLAANFAVYAFLLLLIGAVSLGVEACQSSR